MVYAPGEWTIRLAAAILCAVAAPVASQTAYPSKPVRLIAPFPPGGTSDVLSRILAQKLSDSLGRQVIVENRPGAGGNIGHEVAAKTAPDGYTLLLSSNAALVANPLLYKRLGFDPLNDFSPISIVAKAGPVLVVHPSVPARNVKELIALAKAKPGQLNFGSGGRGTPAHVVGEMFKSAADIRIIHVPYKGGILAVMDLVAGQIDLMFADMAPAVPQIKAGKLRALAVTSEGRLRRCPRCRRWWKPVCGARARNTWWALVTPKARRPPSSRASIPTGADPEAPRRTRALWTLGINPVHTAPEQVMAAVREESPQLAKILKAAGVRA
jgi:tripartite-type tricarboxylate transporter receptor subunit TctC